MTREKILLVDDHPPNLEILRMILEDQFEIAEAMSGEEALALAESFEPSLVLLDIMMPGIDGYETCRRLRQLGAVSSAKIVMVSAKAMASERVQGYEAGADDYITKPFEIDELRAKVEVYMRLRRAEDVSRMKSDVLALLNHELWTPLTSIKAPLELLMDGSASSDSERNMLLEMIMSSADRLDGLFRKVLSLCALLSDQLELAPRELSLFDTVTDALSKLQEKYQGRSLSIVKDLPPIAQVIADPTHIDFIVDAVLDNAARFSPVRGALQVRLSEDGEFWCLRVEDEGAGIQADLLPRVFEPFACSDMDLHSGGHGLSLALTKRLLEAQRGSIVIEKSSPTGTAVLIQLPKA